MNKRIGMVWAFAALLLSGALYPGAQAGAEDRAFAGLGGGAHFPGGLMLGALDLSEAQRDQIKALATANRTAVEPYRKQFRESVKAMRDATANGQFDEAQVRAIAQTQAQANVELTVTAEKLKAEIYNVLTSEQRAKLAERQARMEGKFREHRNPEKQ